MQRREFLQSSLGALAFSACAGAPERALSLPKDLASETWVDSGTHRILYVLGAFSQATPQTMQTVVDAIGGSSFNVLVLSFLQASFRGGKLTLSYNGNAFPLAPEVPRLLSRLRSGFGERKRIIFSIGGWQHKPTFDAIRSFGVPGFVRQLAEQVIAPLGLDGIDLDLEPQEGGLNRWMAVHFEHGKTIVDITNEYKRFHASHLITHAPISAVAAELYAKQTRIPGLNGSLLKATRRKGGNNIDWLNVQFYEGGVVEGGDIAGFYCNSLASPLLAARQQTGIAQPLEFLTPLFEPAAKQPLAVCQQTIESINRRCAGQNAGKVNGIALWDYDQVAPNIGEWSLTLKHIFNGRLVKP